MAQVASLASLNLPTTSAYFRFVNDSPLFETEKPYEILVGNLPPEQEFMRQNITFSGHPGVPIRDLRPFPSMLHLNVREEDGLKEYLGKTREILIDHLDAEEIIMFDYNIRNSAVAGDTGTGYTSGGFHKAPDPPALEVHTDTTKDSGLRRIRRHLTKQEEDQYLDGAWCLRIVK
ncbi:hypothetical protein IFR05_015165 [Cadophora sp. M221]|nr:hypothetical protein IFR05_015165 [Cadophora sp. M221]